MLRVGEIVASNLEDLVVLLMHHGVIDADEPYALIRGTLMTYNECPKVTFVIVEEV